jgi:hypothetical protein
MYYSLRKTILLTIPYFVANFDYFKRKDMETYNMQPFGKFRQLFGGEKVVTMQNGEKVSEQSCEQWLKKPHRCMLKAIILKLTICSMPNAK